MKPPKLFIYLRSKCIVCLWFFFHFILSVSEIADNYDEKGYGGGCADDGSVQ